MVRRQRRLWPAAALAAIGALALPSAASAEIIEIGDLGTEVTPSCPSTPCLAVNRTTGYQAKVGTRRGLMKVPRQRPHRGLDDPAGQAGSAPDPVLQPAAGRRVHRAADDPAHRNEAARPCHRPGRAPEARARTSARGPVRPRALHPGPQGPGHRPHRPHLGPGAGREPRRRHVLARRPRPRQLRRQPDADPPRRRRTRRSTTASTARPA